MTFESTRIHKAWTEQVGRERKGAEWFYRTVGGAGKTQRWTELAEIMHRPEYAAEFLFHRTKSAFGPQKVQSRGDLLQNYFKEAAAHRSKVQQVVDMPSLRRTLPVHRSATAYFGLSKQSTRTKTSNARVYSQSRLTRPLPL